MLCDKQLLVSDNVVTSSTITRSCHLFSRCKTSSFFYL